MTLSATGYQGARVVAILVALAAVLASSALLIPRFGLAGLLYASGIGVAALYPIYLGVLLYRDMPIGLTPRNAMVLATVLLAVTAGLSLSHLGAS